jgi:hypothetical protein
VTLNWRMWPIGFRAAAVTTGAIAIAMSLIPTLVYLAMAPVVRWNVLLDSLVWRSSPILLVYGIALTAAVLLDPVKRSVVGAAFLTATSPAAIALMIYGLR